MNLKAIDTQTLAAELRRREKSQKKLLNKRTRLLKELAEVEAELAAFGSLPSAGRSVAVGRTATGTPRRRAQNDVTLGDALAQAMEIRAIVTPSEAAKLVMANGYKTTSKNFAMMVSNTLAKDKRFKRISRGQYERIG